MLRIISSAPWYVSNHTLHCDFDIPYVTEVVRINANKYKNRQQIKKLSTVINWSELSSTPQSIDLAQ